MNFELSALETEKIKCVAFDTNFLIDILPTKCRVLKRSNLWPALLFSSTIKDGFQDQEARSQSAKVTFSIYVKNIFEAVSDP